MSRILSERTDEVLDRILDAVEHDGASVDDAVQQALEGEPEDVVEQVRGMLPNLFGEGDLLDQGVFGAAPQIGRRLALSEDGATEQEFAAGDEIGAYRLLEEIGRGGMGVVFLAERADDQFRQEVAIKLLSGSMVGRAARRRFLEERQFLADLTHPSIARLLDGGVTESGDPYLVMERIRGQRIDRYCEERRLPVEERLALFLDVCDAVQAAHRKLIVHRDLKPANILVSEDGQVKLLDFGIASLLDVDGESSAATRTMVRAFTPEYASPEQLRGERAAVPSDVYSLGVLLYCLLVGRPPVEIRGLDLVEATRLLVEGEPVPPSRTLRSGSPDRAARSRSRRVRGDLDNVTLKALAKDANVRYGSVAELAADLRSHLAGLPVAARAATPSYRARKFLARHRVGVAATAAILLSLLLGLWMTRMQAREAAAQRDRAQTEATKAELVAGFLVDLFAAADPFAEELEEPSARQLLERAERRIDDELQDAPAARAEMLAAIGRAYRGIGDLARGRALLEESLRLYRGLDRPEPAELAEALVEMAITVNRQDFGRARALSEEALAVLDDAGLDAPSLRARTSALMARLGDTPSEQKERLFRHALELHRLAGEEAGAEVANIVQNLGSVLEARGEFEESVRLKRESLQMIERSLGVEHPMYYQVTNNLGLVLQLRGDLVGAERHYRQAVTGLERRLQADHPALANPYSNLGKVLLDLGRRDQAELYIEAAARIGSADPDPSFSTAGQQINLATLRREQGRFAESTHLYEQARSFLGEHLGAEHAAVARLDSLIGQVLRLQGDDLAAANVLERVLTIQARSSPRDRALAESRRHLGGVLCDRGEFERGPALVEQGCDGFESLELDPIRTAECALERASCSVGSEVTAGRHLERVEQILRGRLPDDHFLWDRLQGVRDRLDRGGPP